MAQTIELSVTGMTCDHCVNAVTGAVKDVPGVAEAKVSLEEQSAVVQGDDIDVDKIIEAIKEEGYEASVK
jgi:copper chaperone